MGEIDRRCEADSESVFLLWERKIWQQGDAGAFFIPFSKTVLDDMCVQARLAFDEIEGERCAGNTSESTTKKVLEIACDVPEIQVPGVRKIGRRLAIFWNRRWRRSMRPVPLDTPDTGVGRE